MATAGDHRGPVRPVRASPTAASSASVGNRATPTEGPPAAAGDPSPMDELGGMPGAGPSRTVRVPWQVAAVPMVRRVIVADLVARDVDAVLVDETEIVVSELVANAVRHARALADGTLRVRWRVRGGVVEIEVSDGGGSTAPRPAPRSMWTAAGRGLRIVRSLAHEWGVEDDRTGRTVWASLGGPSRRRGF